MRLASYLLPVLLTYAAAASATGYGLDQLPRFDDVRLAPSGDHLLTLESDGEAYALKVRDLKTDQQVTAFAPARDQGYINWCAWANDTRIICSMRYYKGSGRIGHVIHTRLMAVNHDGSELLPLIPRAKNYDRRPPAYNAQVQDRVISWLPLEPENVMVQLNREDANRPSVYKLNIYTNRLSRKARARGKVRRWFANMEGDIKLAIGYRNDRTPVMYSFDGRLREFDDPIYRSEVPPAPLGFTADNRHVFMNMTNGTDRHGIYRVQVDDGQVVNEIFTDDDFDVFGSLVLHPETGEPVGVRYLKHHPEMVWFDDNLNRLFEHITSKLPGTRHQLMSSDRHYRHFVFYVYGGVSPAYYHYRLADDSLSLIGYDFPELPDQEVVDLEPVQYETRDGLQIPAYLATPKRAEGRVPTVLLPHGGPYDRDSARFDPWVQHLVQMGVAVLKPNYRGSVGYGEFFMQAGYKQWGQKMQDDLMDGLTWLVGEGVADPERVCVVGASYGGYTALVSAYKFADRVNCAVSMAGISNLEQMVERIYRFDLVRRNRERIQSSDQLRANSPYHQVADIDVPILLVHGKYDTVVRVKQSRKMAEALQKHGKNYRYIEQANGDHFLSSGEHRQEFFGEMAKFLNDHLAIN